MHLQVSQMVTTSEQLAKCIYTVHMCPMHAIKQTLLLDLWAVYTFGGGLNVYVQACSHSGRTSGGTMRTGSPM